MNKGHKPPPRTYSPGKWNNMSRTEHVFQEETRLGDIPALPFISYVASTMILSLSEAQLPQLSNGRIAPPSLLGGWEDRLQHHVWCTSYVVWRSVPSSSQAPSPNTHLWAQSTGLLRGSFQVWGYPRPPYNLQSAMTTHSQLRAGNARHGSPLLPSSKRIFPFYIQSWNETILLMHQRGMFKPYLLCPSQVARALESEGEGPKRVLRFREILNAWAVHRWTGRLHSTQRPEAPKPLWTAGHQTAGKGSPA